MSPLTKGILLIFSIALLLILSFRIINVRSASEQKIISPLAQTLGEAQEPLEPYHDPGLKLVIDQALEGTRGTYAIYYKNLKTAETYFQHEEKIYPAASLYKLWLMATTFKLINEGKLSEDEQLKKDAAELNKIFDIATESAELTEGGVAMSVSEATEKSITISHNYAALLLTSRVKVSNMRQFLKDEGFAYSSIGQPPYTSAIDIAKFYEKLYKGQLISREYSDKMLAILKKQRLNDRIPKYLPDIIEVAHKTGEIDTFKHDAGIVFTPKGDYILVVLSESTVPLQAAERIARVSDAIYTYVQRKK